MKMNNLMVEPNTDANTSQARDSASFQQWKRLCLLVMCLSAVGMIWGICGTYGWLMREFSRMSPWRAVAICASEAVALFWFIHFLIARFLLRRERRSDEPLLGSYRLVFIWFAISTLGGWTLDMAVTINYLVSARDDYANARPVEAMVTSVDAFQVTTLLTDYDVSATYADDQGQTYPIRVRLRDSSRKSRESRESVHLVPELHKHLQTGDTPFSMPIRYDPNRPRRYWVDLGYWGVPHANLVQMSFLVGVFQLCPVVLVVAFALRFGLRLREKLLPWWCEFFGFLPLMLDAIILFVRAMFSRPL
jgi:hypothetical protein